MKKKDEYRYFISFFINVGQNAWSFSWADISRKQKIKTGNDLMEITHDLEKLDERFKKVIILNYKLLD